MSNLRMHKKLDSATPMFSDGQFEAARSTILGPLLLVVVVAKMEEKEKPSGVPAFVWNRRKRKKQITQGLIVRKVRIRNLKLKGTFLALFIRRR